MLCFCAVFAEEEESEEEKEKRRIKERSRQEFFAAIEEECMYM